MKMKKFLIIYLFSILLAIILLLILRQKNDDDQAQVNVNKNHRKKIVVISTFEIEPIARVVRESENSRIIFEWMKVKDAVLVMEEEIKSHNKDRRFNIYLQYPELRNAKTS